MFVNTLYGDFASPYFPIGNTIVANNITAKARVGTWMMSKALHTRQSITDGGMYALREVPLFTDTAKKLGFEGLHDQTNWLEKHKYTRVIGPLGDVNWEDELQKYKDNPQGYENKLQENLDTEAEKHVSKFWSKYNLVLPFKVEHKVEGTFEVAAYESKAHYMLRQVVDGDKYKIRGAKEFKDVSYTKHPMFEILTNTVEGSNLWPSSNIYSHTYLLKVKKWCLAQDTTGYKNIVHLMPGDLVEETRPFRVNNTWTFCDTAKEYKARVRQANRLVDGKSQPLYEKFGPDGGISLVRTKALSGDLRQGRNQHTK